MRPSYFLAQFNPPEAQNITITATYSSTGGTHVVLNATASVPTTFAAILGINAVNLSEFIYRRLGIGTTAGGAGARQYRVYGAKRKNARAANGGK